MQTEQIELDHRLGNRSLEAIGLGNLAESYVRMGVYKQARNLIEQSRAINEALDAHRGRAYNLISLGDIYRKTGDLRKARQVYEQALQEISPTQDSWGKVTIFNGLGMVLLEMGDAPGASRRFAEGRELALSQGMVPPLCETSAGLAACALMSGQSDEGRQFIHEAWDHLKKHGWMGMDNPGMIYRSCAETFDILGEAENSQAAIESGHQVLMELADKINIPEWRQSFLENVPDNRAIMEMWERRTQAPTPS